MRRLTLTAAAVLLATPIFPVTAADNGGMDPIFGAVGDKGGEKARRQTERQERRVESRVDKETDEAMDKAVDKALDGLFD